MKTIKTAFKVHGWTNLPLDEPVVWHLAHDQAVSLAAVSCFSEVNTPEGVMQLVKLQYKTTWLGGEDAAANVGYATKFTMSGARAPDQPILWLWQERFFLQARTIDGNLWTDRTRRCLLYEVLVRDHESLMNSVHLREQNE